MLLGFPQDEGIRRNQGRAGAAAAPQAIRHWLYRLTPWDAASDADLSRHPPLDLGDVCVEGTLEESQQALGRVVAAVLRRGAVPIVLGGGHETAFGHYLGHVEAALPVGIVNVDAHLDVRPCLGSQGHSGSPFRQALEHPTAPLPGNRYVCLGVQPQSLSRAHWEYVRQRGGVVYTRESLNPSVAICFRHEVDRLAAQGCRVHLSLDADVVRQADVPGVSAPNPTGLPGEDVAALARLAGCLAPVSSLELVEISPPYDPDGRSARWGALVVWQFLVGLEQRCRSGSPNRVSGEVR